MKIKFIYQNGPFYYEAECVNEQERKEAIKGLIYATKDLFESKLLTYGETSESVAENIQEQEVSVEPVDPKFDLATDGQIKYMIKLGINIPMGCTKIQAIDLINEYKAAHGIPVNTNYK